VYSVYRRNNFHFSRNRSRLVRPRVRLFWLARRIKTSVESSGRPITNATLWNSTYIEENRKTKLVIIANLRIKFSHAYKAHDVFTNISIMTVFIRKKLPSVNLQNWTERNTFNGMTRNELYEQFERKRLIR